MLTLAAIYLPSKNYFLLKDFYTSILKTPILFESDEQDYLELECGKGQLIITKSKQDISQNLKFAFHVEDVKAFRKTLQEDNIAVSPLKMNKGKLTFELKDSDGNTIVFY